jgi:hypothetical protein
MMGSTREIMDARAESCDDDTSAPDGREHAGERGLQVTVILIDQGTVIVDALDWF